ncbi:serine/arginine-rich splicing factor 2-like isoform X2 [Lineus longissimus]|uniref:serine/arginine-rich splicing factor 2-like isoform X2 n=1 Tax=Lineus longissimus TaxID=88925 RepID=UPI00315DB767
MSSYPRAPPDIHGMTSLKVDNLTYCTTVEDLRRSFEEFGEIGDVYIPRDRYSRESRGFAFIRFTQRKHAERAIHSLDGTKLDGRKITVQLAKYGRPQEPYRRPRGGRYGGGGGGGRRDGGRYGGRYSRSRSRSPVYRRDRYDRSRSRSPYASRMRGRSRSRSSSISERMPRNNVQLSRSRSRSLERHHHHHSRSRSIERPHRHSRSRSRSNS